MCFQSVCERWGSLGDGFEGRVQGVDQLDGGCWSASCHGQGEHSGTDIIRTCVRRKRRDSRVAKYFGFPAS